MQWTCLRRILDYTMLSIQGFTTVWELLAMLKSYCNWSLCMCSVDCRYGFWHPLFTNCMCHSTDYLSDCRYSHSVTHSNCSKGVSCCNEPAAMEKHSFKILVRKQGAQYCWCCHQKFSQNLDFWFDWREKQLYLQKIKKCACYGRKKRLSAFTWNFSVHS